MTWVQKGKIGCTQDRSLIYSLGIPDCLDSLFMSMCLTVIFLQRSFIGPHSLAPLAYEIHVSTADQSAV